MSFAIYIGVPNDIGLGSNPPRVDWPIFLHPPWWTFPTTGRHLPLPPQVEVLRPGCPVQKNQEEFPACPLVPKNNRSPALVLLLLPPPLVLLLLPPPLVQLLLPPPPGLRLHHHQSHPPPVRPCRCRHRPHQRAPPPLMAPPPAPPNRAPPPPAPPPPPPASPSPFSTSPSSSGSSSC
ncbi:pollen-specific leucine-rich repeat extensin-like protein 2 [Neltuma alba]|uniref:pollen-specific leucine-rich repeat extensin-like protein 2 n=1 Tax=Neltuma alba TaxID=207710 RepID=UPI0010A4B2F3|nr:pollen-specific leucine-rich repeat extensin-like protein 2 [Prosopis alba]